MAGSLVMTWQLWVGSDQDPDLEREGGQQLTGSNWRRWLESPWADRAWTRWDLMPRGRPARGRYYAQGELWDLMLAAPSVHYRPYQTWSDEPPLPDLPLDYDQWFRQDHHWTWVPGRILTEFLLDRKQELDPGSVLGLPSTQPPEPRLEVVAQRQTNRPELWVAGCSIAHGLGIRPEQRWAHLVAVERSQQINWLTRRGSSLEWQHDQISRAQIQQGDVVMWGLTSELRMPCSRSGYIIPWPGSGDRESGVNELFDETQWYRAVTQLARVRDLMRLRGARLVLLPCLITERLWRHIQHWPERVTWPWQSGWLDLGRDSWHPGPHQHTVWAQAVLDHLSRPG